MPSRCKTSSYDRKTAFRVQLIHQQSWRSTTVLRPAVGYSSGQEDRSRAGLDGSVQPGRGLQTISWWSFVSPRHGMTLRQSHDLTVLSAPTGRRPFDFSHSRLGHRSHLPFYANLGSVAVDEVPAPAGPCTEYGPRSGHLTSECSFTPFLATLALRYHYPMTCRLSSTLLISGEPRTDRRLHAWGMDKDQTPWA